MSEYDECNLTELAVIAKHISPYAHRVLGREQLLEIIQSGVDPYGGVLSPIEIVRAHV